MQADWEFEIGAGAPVIDGAWSGLIDLQRHPERAADIAETLLVPSLGPALLRLNGPGSPVWTAKCDVWTPEDFDPDELDAPATETACAKACYIDLLPRVAADWSHPAALEAFCRHLCEILASVPAVCCRADLVVRRAVLAAAQETTGITAYLTASGASDQRASAALSVALSALADSLCPRRPLQQRA